MSKRISEQQGAPGNKSFPKVMSLAVMSPVKENISLRGENGRDAFFSSKSIHQDYASPAESDLHAPMSLILLTYLRAPSCCQSK